MNRRAVLAGFAALASASAIALPLGLRLTQQAVLAAKSKPAKDPLLMTEAEAYEYYAPDTAFVIDLSLIGTNEFYLCPASKGSSLNHAVVDWGDGTKEEWDAWYWGTKRTHTYATQGRYVIRIHGVNEAHYQQSSTQKSAIIRILRFADDNANPFVCDSCTNLLALADGRLPRWPKNVTYIGEVYRFCTALSPVELPEWPEGVTTIRAVYGNCTAFNLTKIPEWPSTLECLDMGGNGSTGLYGNMPNLRLTTLPKWPKSLKRITAFNWNGVFRGCPNVTAEPPEWPEGLEEATMVYNYGTKLSGRIPKWPDGLTSANGTFRDCTGLTGEIPAWPSSLTQANYTFYNCTSLAPTELPAWPSSLTQANYTYSDCTSLAATALPDWPESLTSCEGVYWNCQKMAATNIPPWSKCEKLTNVNYAYRYCYALCAELPSDLWSDSITTARQTFDGDSKITGIIPKWPTSLTALQYTFWNNKGLTGAWTDDPDELMPSTITTHDNVVTAASDALRKLFYQSWGGDLPDPSN